METKAAEPGKKKKSHWILYVSILAFLLLVTGLIMWMRPFVWQKTDWLNANAASKTIGTVTGFTTAVYAKMTDAEIVTAYTILEKYNGALSSADAATQAAWNAMVTKYAAPTT